MPRKENYWRNIGARLQEGYNLLADSNPEFREDEYTSYGDSVLELIDRYGEPINPERTFEGHISREFLF